MSDFVDRSLFDPTVGKFVPVGRHRSPVSELRLDRAQGCARRLTAERLVRFMSELRSDLPGLERESLITAFREVLLNAMEHGAGFNPELVVEVAAIHSQRAITYYFAILVPASTGKTCRTPPTQTRPQIRSDILSTVMLTGCVQAASES
jgi:hypothetical protein